MDEFIRINGEGNIIHQLGLRTLIEALGFEEALEELGLEVLLDNLTPDQRRKLKRRLSKKVPRKSRQRSPTT